MSNLSITTKTDNKTRSDVAANKKIPASEINEMVSWMNSPMSNLGTFSSTVDFSTQGYYADRTLSGNETWDFSNIVAGVVQYNKITVSGGETISVGTNGRVINGSLGTLAAGTYDIWLASPSGSEVLISVPGVSTANAPTLTSLTIENATDSIVDAVFDEAVTITTDGWNIDTDGAALSITGIASGSGTSTPKFQLSRSVLSSETLNMDYNPSTGSTVSVASGIELATITNRSVTNSILFNSQSGSFSPAKYANISTKASNLEPIGGSAAMSWSIWVNPSSINDNRSVFWAGVASGNPFYTRYVVSIIASNHGAVPDYVDMLIYGSDQTKYLTIRTGAALTLNTWNHLLFTYDAATKTMKAYINSTESGNATTDVSFDAYDDNGSTRVFIGKQDISVNPDNYTGLLDEISVYNKVLNQTEVNEIYNSGAPNDLSGLSNYSNCVSWWRLEGDVTDEKGVNDLTNSGVTFSSDVP